MELILNHLHAQCGLTVTPFCLLLNLSFCLDGSVPEIRRPGSVCIKHPCNALDGGFAGPQLLHVTLRPAGLPVLEAAARRNAHIVAH